MKESKNYERFIPCAREDREQYIISQALYFGIKHIQDQPAEFRENSNMWDMADLLNKKYPHYKASAERMDPEFDAVMKSARRPPDLKQVK